MPGQKFFLKHHTSKRRITHTMEYDEYNEYNDDAPLEIGGNGGTI
jgi:hypothetical protein